jgi:hypothetical protein
MERIDKKRCQVEDKDTGAWVAREDQRLADAYQSRNSSNIFDPSRARGRRVQGLGARRRRRSSDRFIARLGNWFSAF